MNRRLWTAAAGLGTLAAFVLAGQLLRAPKKTPQLNAEVPLERPEAAPIVEDLDVALPRTARTGADVFGINEGMALPLQGVLAGRATTIDLHALKSRAELIDRLGVGWVRVNSHGFGGLNHLDVGGDWTNPDALLAEIDRAGLRAVVVIGPWPGAKTGNYTGDYVPEDLDAYGAWVSEAAERYARYDVVWELDNEPDLHNSEPPRGAKTKARPGSFQTPAEYATVLLVTAAAIREVDPEATLLSGGMYRANTPKGKTYLEQVLKQPGVLDAVDGISLHLYFAETGLDPLYRLMDVARELAPNKPVWITETPVPSSAERAEIASPEWQAERLVAMHGALLSEGADRIFWHSLVDAPSNLTGPSGMRSNSLFERIGEGVARVEPKPAAEVYTRLVGHLAEQPLEDVEVVDGALGFRDGWLVWQGEIDTPEGVTVVEDLLTGQVREAGPSLTAPAWGS